MPPFVVGIRFSQVGKIYHFEANSLPDLKVGEKVIVDTARGQQLGEVAQIVENPQPPPEGWKSVGRRATPRDLLLRQYWQLKENEVVEACRTRTKELNLHGVKIIAAEYSFDGSKLTILFQAEQEEKVDLKSLKQDMQRMQSPSQVELRQIGPRDVAKMLGGMGACGLECRCCTKFLTDFSSIAIKMAKDQGISLTPTEITGMCGRLRCCLIYEYPIYQEARQKLPKRNKRVMTPSGEGKVIDVIPLREIVIVDLPEVGHREFPVDQITVLDDSAPVVEKPKPSGSPSQQRNHPGKPSRPQRSNDDISKD
ncbi:MAG TPA: regulatory iron-sulfur-containing complex subunit RicT [Anaerolineaceae bacterium]